MLAFTIVWYTVEPQSYESPWNEGVHKFEMPATLKSSSSLKIHCVVLFNFHEEYAAMISIEHKLANTEARANMEQNLITVTLFI